MPRYSYRCDKCECTMDVTHSMKERYTDCSECEAEDSLTRVPSTFFSESIISESRENIKPGEKVKEYIEEVREEIRTEKQRLRERKHE